MNYQNITCIINPSSGKDTPILGAINKAVQKSDAHWSLNITQKQGDIARFVQKGLERKSDLFIVYGGDRSVMEAARVLVSHNVPMLILPGGTANVISKELQIPQDPGDVFKLLLKDKVEVHAIDMGIVDETPFLLRVNFGIFAEMITQTNTETKQNLGQLAYGITAATQLPKVTPKKYTITLDSGKIITEAVGLMVTNVGSVGIGSLTLNQNINSNDGLLDIVIVESLDLSSILNLAASTLTQSDFQGKIQHYQSKIVKIETDTSQEVICDDEPKTFSKYNFTINPAALSVLIPKKE